MKPGIYGNISNEDYHAGAGISKSGLDQIDKSPAVYDWNKSAPVDDSKLGALDFGSHFHAYFLEPDLFKEQYKVLPVFNRRKVAEKQAELDLIAEWKAAGITPVKAEDMTKLEAMRMSAMAHPVVAEIMAMKGNAEQSIFWNDPETGELCKCRPDYLVWPRPGESQLQPSWMERGATILIADVKTTADVNKIANSMADYRYHVQDAFYSQGTKIVCDGIVDFIFIFVSTTINCGKYPVRVMRLTEPAKYDGYTLARRALDTYHSHNQSPILDIESIDLPHWAYLTDEIL